MQTVSTGTATPPGSKSNRATLSGGVVGQLQLALRHPANRGETTKIARRFIEQIRRQVPEGLQRNIDAGFNPEFDV